MLITNELGWNEEGLYLLIKWTGARLRSLTYISEEERELQEEPYASKIALLEKLHGLPKNHIINEYRKLNLNTST